jgi:hypothetical protein
MERKTAFLFGSLSSSHKFSSLRRPETGMFAAEQVSRPAIFYDITMS